LNGPFGSSGREGVIVALELLGNFDILRVFTIGVLDKSQQEFDNVGSVSDGGPRLLQMLHADVTGGVVDTGVVDLGNKFGVGELEGIIVKVELHDEDTSNVGSTLRSRNLHIPLENIISFKFNSHSFERVAVEVVELLNKTISRLRDMRLARLRLGLPC